MSDLRAAYEDLVAVAEEAIEYGGRPELERVIRGLLTIADAFAEIAEEEFANYGAIILTGAMPTTSQEA